MIVDYDAKSTLFKVGRFASYLVELLHYLIFSLRQNILQLVLSLGILLLIYVQINLPYNINPNMILNLH